MTVARASSFAFEPRRLDAARFASERGALSGRAPLADFARLAAEAVTGAIAADAPVVIDWQAQGETRRDAGLDDGVAYPALHLRAHTRLPLTCQRCLQPVWMAVAVDRHFLFAPDEAQAARLDEQAEDDVLALAPDASSGGVADGFDLHGLIEDELLLALPLSPRHEHCPHAPPLSARDAGFDAAAAQEPHPFAALAALKTGKHGTGDL